MTTTHNAQTTQLRLLWMTLFALTVCDFYLTLGLIDVIGLEAEANTFMRRLFAYHPSGLAALGYKIISFAALYYVLHDYHDKSFVKMILCMSVLLYTSIIYYSLVLTHFEWFYDKFRQIESTLFY